MVSAQPIFVPYRAHLRGHRDPAIDFTDLYQNEWSIGYHVDGRRIPATRDEPAEDPEIVITRISLGGIEIPLAAVTEDFIDAAREAIAEIEHNQENYDESY